MKRSSQIGQFICVFLFPLLYEGNSLRGYPESMGWTSGIDSKLKSYVNPASRRRKLLSDIDLRR